MGYKASCITSKKTLSKGFFFDGQGILQKRPGAQLTSGICTLEDFDGPVQFAAYLTAMKQNQVLTYGVGCDKPTPIFCRAMAGPGDLTRTKDRFRFLPDLGIWMIDHDIWPGGPLYSPEELLRVLIEVCPDIAGAPMVQGFSGSGFIYNAETGEMLKGQGGQRLYIFVKDARDIPRAGKALYERLWLAGYGRFDVSKSGSKLDRTIIDGSVWSPERLDFAAGAACDWPLIQTRPPFIVHNPDAAPLETRLCQF